MPSLSDIRMGVALGVSVGEPASGYVVMPKFCYIHRINHVGLTLCLSLLGVRIRWRASLSKD